MKSTRDVLLGVLTFLEENQATAQLLYDSTYNKTKCPEAAMAAYSEHIIKAYRQLQGRVRSQIKYY